jgi:hypothetical protein
MTNGHGAGWLGSTGVSMSQGHAVGGFVGGVVDGGGVSLGGALTGSLGTGDDGSSDGGVLGSSLGGVDGSELGGALGSGLAARIVIGNANSTTSAKSSFIGSPSPFVRMVRAAHSATPGETN